MDEFPVELHRITVTIKCIVCQKVRQDQHTTKFNRTGASKKPTAPHLTVFVGLNFLNFFLYRNIIECPSSPLLPMGFVRNTLANTSRFPSF